MAACGEPGEDADLYATVKAVGMELCPQLGISIPVGKDSLSMRTQWQEDGVPKKVTSPVSLIITGFAAIDDVRGTLTPQLDARGAGQLAGAHRPGPGQNRMGGSILGQVLGQSGNTTPDLDNADDLKALVAAVNALRQQGLILAYHDRGDGGLLATVAEMAFAGHVGVALNVDMLVTEGDGITDGRMDSGEGKNWGQQIAGRREDLHPAGPVQRRTGRGAANSHRRAHAKSCRCCAQHGLIRVQPHHWQTRPASSPVDMGKGELQDLARCAKSLWGQLGKPAPGVGCRELENRPATRQPRLRRQRTRRRWRWPTTRHARAPHVRPTGRRGRPCT